MMSVVTGFAQIQQKDNKLSPLSPNFSKFPPAFTKSRLAIAQTEFDFGLVPRNTKLIHAFKYGVSVVDTVKILRTTSSCGCTFAEIPKKPLAPKDTGFIKVTYTTGIVEGPFEKSFTLYTNSENTPEIQLILKGNVIRCVWTDPPLINLDEAQLSSSWKNDVKIHWMRMAKPGFKKPIKASDCLSLSSITQDKVDSTLWHLNVTLSPKATTKYLCDTMVLQTSDTTWKEIKIPIQGTIADVVITKPLVVNMGEVKIGQQVNNSFLVVSSVPGASVASVKSTTPFVAAQKGKIEGNGKMIRINLSTAGEPQPGAIGTDIVVTVHIAGQNHELKVPVVGRFVK